ncbi:MAG: DUF2283 domain-containing protein [Betaproteobacteria bacterium HGW-Betaproteobacteria-7]|nr:MAG: DUF2283 domain-containing protein [Betaproteobacteria bacterium HGW-Betaproteobacteria-7]
MKIDYDPATDALYVHLSDLPIIESEQIKPGIVLDYDEDGSVVGIEVLSASKNDNAPPKQSA